MYCTVKLFEAYSKINKVDQPFYASDLGLTGGQITALFNCDFIAETGNTKTMLIPIDTYNGEYYKKVTVKEWTVTPRATTAQTRKNIIKDIENYIDIAEALKQIKETI